MSEAVKIALTALVGFVVFVFGQFFQRLIIEPIQEQRRIKGRIANALSVYQNTWVARQSCDISAECKAIVNEASKALHGLAADLRASVVVVPCYPLWESLGWVLRAKIAWEVADDLLRWGGFNGPEDSIYRRKHVMTLLNIGFGRVPSEDGVPLRTDKKTPGSMTAA